MCEHYVKSESVESWFFISPYFVFCLFFQVRKIVWTSWLMFFCWSFIRFTINTYTLCCHINKWFVLSSRPAISLTFAPVVRKSSKPSPPDIIKVWIDSLSVELFEGFRFVTISFVSTEVRNLAWPVCPCGIPVRNYKGLNSQITKNMNKSPCKPVTMGLLLPIFWNETVTNTPAVVPTQIISLHARREVTRRHASLCCWIILSQLLSILVTVGAKLTSDTIWCLFKNKLN